MTKTRRLLEALSISLRYRSATACRRTCKEAFHLFWDDIHASCRWYDLATIAPITDEHIQKLIAEPHADFHVMDLSNKLKRLKKLFGIEFPEDALERTRSLNRVRNCYAHRRGVVRAEEVNAAPDGLLVKWLGLRREIAGKKYPITGEVTLEANETMNIVICPVDRRFKVGDSLSFSSSEFAEFGVTYLFLAQSVVPKLRSFAQQCFDKKVAIGK